MVVDAVCTEPLARPMGLLALGPLYSERGSPSLEHRLEPFIIRLARSHRDFVNNSETCAPKFPSPTIPTAALVIPWTAVFDADDERDNCARCRALSKDRR
jgi:hypothetical protein